MKNASDQAFAMSGMPYLVKSLVTQFVTWRPRIERGKSVNTVNERESGFSLIELLLVVVTVGVLAAIAVPHLQKGIRASENGNMFSTMRTIISAQANFYSQNNRFGRISEINNATSVGTASGNDVNRGKFVLSMIPESPQPTDLELKDGYTIRATRSIAGEGVTYIYEITEAGNIRQIQP